MSLNRSCFIESVTVSNINYFIIFVCHKQKQCHGTTIGWRSAFHLKGSSPHTQIMIKYLRAYLLHHGLVAGGSRRCLCVCVNMYFQQSRLAVSQTSLNCIEHVPKLSQCRTRAEHIDRNQRQKMVNPKMQRVHVSRATAAVSTFLGCSIKNGSHHLLLFHF